MATPITMAMMLAVTFFAMIVIHSVWIALVGMNSNTYCIYFKKNYRVRVITGII